MSGVPRGWAASKLGDVARWGSGGTPAAGNATYYGGGIPWIVIGDLTEGPVWSTASTISQEGLEASSAKLIPEGAILVAMYGASIGRLGITCRPMTSNQAIAHAIPFERLDAKYLFYYLMSQKRALAAAGKGAAQPNIGQQVLKTWPIAFPESMNEQRRIVDLLEDHLSRLEAADQGLALSIAKLNGLRERTIIHALTGVDAPERVDANLPDVGTSDGDLPSLPLGWEWARLGDVADVVGGITKDAKKQSDPSFIEVPYLRVANVQRGHLKLDVVTQIRADPAKAKSLRLEDGDVLLNEGGDRDKLARGWVWEGQIPACIHQNHVFRARLHEPRLNPYFLSWTGNTLGGRWAEQNGKQSVNLASISLRMIKQMPVIVPAAGEADRVAASLRDQLDSYARLASSLESARERGAALRRSLLAAAFGGRLAGSETDLSVAEEMIGA